jgi:hypothetical protein
MSTTVTPNLTGVEKKHANIFEKAIQKFHLIKSPAGAAEKIYQKIKPKHEDIEGEYWALWLNLQKAHKI